MEWLDGRGREDVLRVWELIDILQMQDYPAEEGDPERGPEYFEGMLKAIRRAGPGPGAR